jgi:hypothetical protein
LVGGSGGGNGRREARAKLVVRGPKRSQRLVEHPSRVVRPDDAFADEARRVGLADGALLLDSLRLKRLGIRGLVLSL